MTQEEKIKLMIEIRNSVYGIVKGVFDCIDKEIQESEIKKDDVKFIRAATIRFSLKTLRHDTLKTIANIGKEFEGDYND